LEKLRGLQEEGESMNNCQQINQDSGNTEYYTPPEIIEAARQVLGFIDLDPASSDIANQTVKAAIFFTADDDGLSKPWYGRVWMNHPFSRANNAAFVKKLVREYTMSRNVEAACCITYAAANGHPTRGCIMYLPWYPCADCARAIIQSGISAIVCMEPDWNDHIWAADFSVVKEMLEESSVTVRFL
jgi:deoxycytidylate deaminase